MEQRRNTKQKQHILSILKTAQRPLSINEIHQCCIEEYPKTAKSTIYRNIDSLLKQNLIDKYYLNDNELFYQIRSYSSEHKHYVVCNECKKIFDLPLCPIHEIQHSLSDYGFQITNHYIQINGICKDCQLKQKKDSTS